MNIFVIHFFGRFNTRGKYLLNNTRHRLNTSLYHHHHHHHRHRHRHHHHHHHHHHHPSICFPVICFPVICSHHRYQSSPSACTSLSMPPSAPIICSRHLYQSSPSACTSLSMPPSAPTSSPAKSSSAADGSSALSPTPPAPPSSPSSAASAALAMAAADSVNSSLYCASLRAAATSLTTLSSNVRANTFTFSFSPTRSITHGMKPSSTSRSTGS